MPIDLYWLIADVDGTPLFANGRDPAPHSRKLSAINLDGQDYVALYKTERAARPFAILPLWQVLPVLDFIQSDE